MPRQFKEPQNIDDDELDEQTGLLLLERRTILSNLQQANQYVVEQTQRLQEVNQKIADHRSERGNRP